MARKSIQLQQSAQGDRIDVTKLGWRELVKLASDRGVYKRGMGKVEVIAALGG